MTEEKCFGAGVVAKDFGHEEYLDGVAMQYVVEQHGRPLAYFKDQEDAELFANAKAAASRTDAVPDYNV